MPNSRHSPTKSPPKVQYLRHPLLQRNRTYSYASYEGNTIDMVRIVRKNEYSRHSLMNIDRKEYLKQNQQYAGDKQGWRHSYYQTKYRGQYYYYHHNQYDDNLSSTFVHQGTDFHYPPNPNIIYHYIRPSNVNILHSTTNYSTNNKVLGLTLFVLFLILFSSYVLVSSYFLNGCHVIFDHIDYILVLNYQYYDSVLEYIERDNFLPILVLYLIIECIYHLVVWGLNIYTGGRYKLIDKYTSRLGYILRCRYITTRNSHSHVQKILKSPKFTILIIILSTMLYSYGIFHCYYYNYLNYIYVYYMSSPIIKLIYIYYFSILLPYAFKFLFFEKMHIIERKGNSATNHQLNYSHDYSEYEGWKLSPLTDFSIDNWWMKLGMIVLLVSFVYSCMVSVWLIVVSFARIYLTFKKMKYRIDTFYLYAVGKLILLISSAILLISRYSSSPSFITPSFTIYSTIIITVSLLLTRILSNMFLRQYLYKYFYSEMNINIAHIVFVFGVVYLVVEWIGEEEFFTWRLIMAAGLAIGLIVGISTEGNHRVIIDFEEKKYRESEAFVEIGNF